MKNDYTVLQATGDDAPGIVRVRRSTWLATYPNSEAGVSTADIEAALNTRTFDAEVESSKKSLSANKPHFHAWVAKIDGQVVGFVTAIKQEERNRIGALYILPEHQRKGIGARLMSEAMKWLGSGKDIFFEVVTYNLPAIAFYKKLGFVENGPTTNAVASLPSGKVLPETEMVRKGINVT